MAEVVPIDKEKKPAQLSMFEGSPVHEYKASLAAAGYLTIPEKLAKGEVVAIHGEGRVSKVIFSEKNGVTTRQHVIVVDAESVSVLRNE